MASKSEDSQNPEEPAKTDEFESSADGPAFFRHLPRNPTQEQIDDYVGRPWFSNWMLSDEARAKPATYAVYYDDEPPEPQAGTHSGSPAGATCDNIQNADGTIDSESDSHSRKPE